MKRFLSILLIAIFCISMCACGRHKTDYDMAGSATETTESEVVGVEFEFDGTTKTLRIFGTGEMDDYTWYEEDSATDCSWYGMRSLITSCEIAEGVTSIGSYSFFGLGEMTEITIPASVTSIGEHAFEGCENLTTVTYLGSVDEWNEIAIADFNTDLASATVICG